MPCHGEDARPEAEALLSARWSPPRRVSRHTLEARRPSLCAGDKANVATSLFNYNTHIAAMVHPDDARCTELAYPDLINFAVSVYVSFDAPRVNTANRPLYSFLVVGILVSYLPQHYKIISRRSSRGLSPMFVLLGTVSGTASIANILTLPESTRDMGCCKEIGSFPCAAAMLGIVQIGVQWSCFFFM
jgi:hypothetical protein